MLSCHFLIFVIIFVVIYLSPQQIIMITDKVNHSLEKGAQKTSLHLSIGEEMAYLDKCTWLA
ncbi:hypothetical protein CEP70_13730 [Providencia stuartii]|uniref:Uncharacterized protein n=1 Tax=Providencia stuartii ATCC 25827 TaxID=471874 RepID=A0AA86YXS4_PROST|nr:hypothetical protein CEP70_13730 [Providencia stuartii]EDU58407.1 hypothetical protein PROSTU_01582 [Providencia stuartii ATCC 25827]KNZ85710.1 hypothetical protein AFL46_08400 [Providencia stuartii]RMA14412.1 hypothetical protein EA147_08115 [Providencia stuartii]